MSKRRLEAFSDGVIAIIITIMVLELRAPEEASLAALRPLVPVLLSYTLSFVYLAIYWNNHHHLLMAIEQVDGRVLWAKRAPAFLAIAGAVRHGLDGRERAVRKVFVRGQDRCSVSATLATNSQFAPEAGVPA